jgi:hypothetical protein
MGSGVMVILESEVRVMVTLESEVRVMVTLESEVRVMITPGEVGVLLTSEVR